MIDITYDRRERQYNWTDPDSGETFTAPAGAANKHELFKTAVAMLDPDLHAAAEAWLLHEPHLERAIWRGVELVAAGAVAPSDDEGGDLLALVASSDAYGRYAVQRVDGWTTCQCPHFTDHAAPLSNDGQRVCKHIAAVTLHQLARI